MAVHSLAPKDARGKKLVRIARDHGIHYPEDALRASRVHDVPLSAICAFLIMETGGGANVWGHDPVRRGQMFGGRVTQASYARYKVLRRLGFGNQGCGPAQLTSPGLQDQADAAGGCWKPLHNISVGAHFLKGLHDTHGSWQLAFQAYNGSGPAAVAYGRAAEALHAHFHDLFKGA